MVCIALWMLVLTMTGKRRDKLRRLLRRDRFLSEVETEESKSEVSHQGYSFYRIKAIKWRENLGISASFSLIISYNPQ